MIRDTKDETFEIREPRKRQSVAIRPTSQYAILEHLILRGIRAFCRLAKSRGLAMLCCPTMNAPDFKANAIEGLERAAQRLEQALEAHLDALRLGSSETSQVSLIESLRSEKQQLQNEIAGLRESIIAQQRRAREDGGKIMRAAEEIRDALGDA